MVDVVTCVSTPLRVPGAPAATSSSWNLTAKTAVGVLLMFLLVARTAVGVLFMFLLASRIKLRSFVFPTVFYRFLQKGFRLFYPLTKYNPNPNAEVSKCTLNNGGCKESCKLDEEGEVVCWCKPWFKLNQDKVSCSRKYMCSAGSRTPGVESFFFSA